MFFSDLLFLHGSPVSFFSISIVFEIFFESSYQVLVYVSEGLLQEALSFSEYLVFKYIKEVINFFFRSVKTRNKNLLATFFLLREFFNIRVFIFSQKPSSKA